MNDPTKVAGAVGAGALVGGVFPLYLFSEFGVQNLIKEAAATTAAAPFAITVFAMTALMIIGVGTALAKVDIPGNKLATSLLAVFGVVFVGGFITTIVLSVTDPQVKVYVRFPEYAENSEFFKGFGLSPYVDDGTRHPPDDTRVSLLPEAQATCRRVMTIEVGVTGIRKVEDRLNAIGDASNSTCFPLSTIPVICSLDGLKSTPACRKYVNEHPLPQGD